MPLAIDRRVQILDETGTLIDVTNPLDVAAVETAAGTAVRTSVTGSLAVVTVLAANAARLGATVFHEGPAKQTLFLALGAGATAADYTVPLHGGDFFEVPFRYVGVVTGIWDIIATLPHARVTELTA